MIEKSIFKDGANKNLTHPKNEKGITLVALIITIVVLLILAVVAIGAVTDSNIIGHAGNAADSYETEKGKENQAIKDAEEVLNQYVNGGKGESLDAAALLAKFTENPEAFKHPEQSSTNNDRAIGTDGTAVNLDLWTYRVVNGEIALNDFNGSSTMTSYKGDFIEGAIIGTMPQYIYIAEEDSIYTVTDTSSAFSGCYDLKVAPVIPSTVTKTSDMFSITSIKEAPVIPVGVTDTSDMFNRCLELEKAPIIPSTVIDASFMFSDCQKLKDAPIIPNGVLYIGSMFSASGITKAPVIPSSVIEIMYIFTSCNKLTGTVRIESPNIDGTYEFEHLLRDNGINKVIVPAGSVTETSLRNFYGSDPNITIETF